MFKRILVYRKILVALDGSKKSFKALKQAAAIANRFDSELILLTVVPKYSQQTRLGYTHERVNENVNPMIPKLWEAHREVLTEGEYRIISEHPGLDLIKKISEGRPPDVIMRVAEEYDVDLIVVGDRGTGQYPDHLLGSTCQRVIEGSSKPVLVVK